MGILNVTPDSFSDGGSHEGEAALVRARAMAAEGADILDIGGESTRPGFTPIGADEEIGRVEPVIRAVAGEIDIPISIDTTKMAVARRAIEAGACIINDIWGFQRDAEMARLAADTSAGVVLMHNRPEADPAIDIISDILDFLRRSVDLALSAGVAPSSIVLDPGIGFGKTADQNLETIRRLPELMALDFPLLIGASRKRFIGALTGVDDPRERIHGSLAAHIAAVLAGAKIVRAHDVAAHRAAFQVLDAIGNHRS
ncbi:dihydropteroate synthase [Terrihabitans sp. B22-R8]|uniref:dihydropteroate synthase n=1 Tax=Terrihabitans sp. B22-R8 TaxID=3425128 RepID=UPI00403C4712